MSRKNINLKCYNQYCVFNKNCNCTREAISLNRLGVCEDVFLVGTDNFKNIQEKK